MKAIILAEGGGALREIVREAEPVPPWEWARLLVGVGALGVSQRV